MATEGNSPEEDALVAEAKEQGTFGKFLQSTLKPFFGKGKDEEPKGEKEYLATKATEKPSSSNSGGAISTPTNAKPDDKFKKYVKPVKWTSAGGVVLHSVTEAGLKQVLLISPKGSYGGYQWTFPKGRVDEGENLVKTAKREVKEESGIEASILPGGYLGVEEGTSSFTHYYMMVRTGGQEGVGTDGESGKVEWVTWAEAFRRMKGSSRDKTILLRAWDFARKLKKKLD